VETSEEMNDLASAEDKILLIMVIETSPVRETVQKGHDVPGERRVRQGAAAVRVGEIDRISNLVNTACQAVPHEALRVRQKRAARNPSQNYHLEGCL
jgi:hypothetical protein